jgi:hypothetical protein
MVAYMARRGWRKSPTQTPVDFVAAVHETGLQKKLAAFTRAYESARFGNSVDDAQSLPELFQDISTEDEKKDEKTADLIAR